MIRLRHNDQRLSTVDIKSGEKHCLANTLWHIVSPLRDCRTRQCGRSHKSACIMRADGAVEARGNRSGSAPASNGSKGHRAMRHFGSESRPRASWHALRWCELLLCKVACCGAARPAILGCALAPPGIHPPRGYIRRPRGPKGKVWARSRTAVIIRVPYPLGDPPRGARGRGNVNFPLYGYFCSA